MEFDTKGNFNNKNLRGVNNFLDKNLDLEEIEIFNINKNLSKLDSYILAGNIHKKVRKIIQPKIQPGINLSYIAELVESTTKRLTGNVGINNGIGFPTGLSLNNCVAHYSPDKNLNLDLKFNKDDILKIDFGVEVNGYLIDSAFTVYFDEKYDILAKAVKEATETGIKNIGVDVYINDWAKDIYEVMTSYDVDGKSISPVTSLGGHNILRRIIHGGMFLPSKPLDYLKNSKFNEGVYAVETFGSMGNGEIETIYNENTLYRLKKINSTTKNKNLNNIIKKLYKNFNTLPFSSRYTDIKKENLQKLVLKNILSEYPPLVDKTGFSAQYEHTIYLEDGKKINLSKDFDY